MSYYQLPKNLSDLDHFRSNPKVQFKEETVGGVQVVIPCYMIADAEFWKIPYALEMRGHVFLKDTGELISAALPKFFNVGENDYTQRKDLPWYKVCSVADKVDGSMITFVVIDNHVYAKTKKSFYSDVAIEAQKYLDNTVEGNKICVAVKNVLESSMSPVMEFWHPEWQIVLNYGTEPTFKYLGFRNMADGSWNPDGKGIENSETIISDLESVQETLEGIEGYVIQFEDGRVVKAKTKWYLGQHKVRTQMRERDIAELAALEKLDDIKSVITEAGLDLSLIEVIESRVANDIASMKTIVEFLVQEAKSKFETPKDVALYYQGTKLFSFIMKGFRDQEIDYVDYFLKNKLQSYSLACVYNSKF